MIKSIISILSLIMINACSITTPHTKYEDKAPSWYNNLPKEDIYSIYIIGEGKTQKQAQEEALDKINKKLGIKITTNYKKEVHYKRAMLNILKEENQKVEEQERYPLEIRNFETISAFERNKGIAVLMRLDKLKYQDFIEEKVKEGVSKLKMQEETAINSDYITKTYIYEDLNKIASEIQAYIEVYHKISGNTARLSREARYIRLLKENYQEILNEKIVSISYEGEASSYKEQLEMYLSENNFLIKNNNQPINITLKTISNYQYKSNNTIYTHKIIIKEYDTVIKSIQFDITESGPKEDNISKSKESFKQNLNHNFIK